MSNQFKLTFYILSNLHRNKNENNTLKIGVKSLTTNS